MLNRLFGLVLTFCLCSCSLSHKINEQARKSLFADSIISHGHVGISVYEPGTGKYWYHHDDDKYFVPASNTKLFSLYAGLRYLGDSLEGLRVLYSKDTAFILPTGDPTFLHPEYAHQRVFQFLKKLKMPVTFLDYNWKTTPLGRGWNWDDYNSSDMTERSSFPIYSNVIRWTQINQHLNKAGEKLIFSEPEINWKVIFNNDSTSKVFNVEREQAQNVYHITFGHEQRKQIEIPFITNGISSALLLLQDTLGKPIQRSDVVSSMKFNVIHSRPSDSMFIPMMHRSDNFFAEQTLLMASAAKFGFMNEQKMISYILENDLKALPQKPLWVDGSGSSRYNLFTPLDFIYILNRLKNEFGLQRMQSILPTGGTGTLSSLYKKDSGYIFAKTGTLSNKVALSGYLQTKKNKLLLFSILVGDFEGTAPRIRKAIEKFLLFIRQHY